jgi:hypothetical protein
LFSFSVVILSTMVLKNLIFNSLSLSSLSINMVHDTIFLLVSLIGQFLKSSS